MNKNQTSYPPDVLSTPYIAYLRALSRDTAPPELDWAIANKNYHLANSRIDRPAQAQAVRTALEAYDAAPGSDAARALCDSLAMHRWLAGLYAEHDIHTLAKGLSVSASTISLLRKIADETPYRVVFINAVTWLLALNRGLDQEFLGIAAFDSALTDAVWYVSEESRDEKAQDDKLRFSLAKAGSFEARQWLYGQLDSELSDDLRGSVLRYAYSETTPESIELYGEPNPKFTPALVDFVNKTKLKDELEADTIDDALCEAALTILSEGVCNCLLNGIELSHFKRTISIEELLSLMIGHLQGRALPLNALFDLAWIYDCVFEEIDRWLSQDPDALFDEDDLVVSRKEHQDLARKIRDVFENPANKKLLDAAVTAGGIDSRNAKLTQDRINGVTPGARRDDFEKLLGELQGSLARGADQRNVPLTGFHAMIEAANGDADSVRKAIEWCEDYLACMGGYGPNLSADAQCVLKEALALLRSRPGLGRGLIRAGLESTTHSHMAMMVLRSYPVDRWPEGIERSLRSAVSRSETDAQMFQGAIDALVAYRAK